VATKKKRPGVSEEIADLARCAASPTAAESREQLRQALVRGEALVVARAGDIVREHLVDGLARELRDAFQRFLRDPVKTDPVCHAKLAVLEALDALEDLDDAPFLAAARHVQLEPAWGPPVDTAVGVRARGILALARLGYTDLPLLAGELLADAAVPVRQAAADALANLGLRGAAGPLVLKLRTGDEEPLVTLSCLTALLAIAPEWGLAAARPMLLGAEAGAREIGALALGQSSRDDALALLLEALEVRRPCGAVHRDRAPPE
jgi:HEAT repeat protein